MARLFLVHVFPGIYVRIDFEYLSRGALHAKRNRNILGFCLIARNPQNIFQ